MNSFQRQNRSVLTGSQKTVFLAKKKLFQVDCGFCQMFVKDQFFIAQKQKQEVSDFQQRHSKEDKCKLIHSGKKSLKASCRINQNLTKKVTCQTEDMLEAQECQKIMNKITFNMTRTVQLPRNIQLHQQNTIKPTVSYQRIVYQKQKNNRVYLRTVSSKFQKDIYTNSKAIQTIPRYKIPMIESINSRHYQSTSSQGKLSAQVSKQVIPNHIPHNKVMFITSVITNISELPVRQMQQGGHSGLNSCNSFKAQNVNGIQKLKSPLIQVKGEYLSECSYKARPGNSLQDDLNHSNHIQAKNESVGNPSSNKQINKLSQTNKPQKLLSKGLGSYFVQLPKSKKFNTFQVKKAVSLIDQQQSSQEQTSEVIYGFRKTNNLSIIEDVMEDMQESMMTKVQHKMEHSNQGKFGNL